MFQGSIVALITPFRQGQLDEAALARLVEWHIEQGTHGIVPVGTTGESPTLTHDEHCRVVELVVKLVAGRIPVIAGAGSNNPVEAIEYTRYAEQMGADATLHVAGYYNRPNQEGLYHHFKAVHDATTKPIIVYNIPPRAIVDVQPATLARLAELPRIAGVKDATGDLARPWVERQLIKKPFAWLSGEDATAVAYNIGGGQGCISVTANVAPSWWPRCRTWRWPVSGKLPANCRTSSFRCTRPCSPSRARRGQVCGLPAGSVQRRVPSAGDAALRGHPPSASAVPCRH